MPTAPLTHRAWWTVDDAAALLRMNPHTLYRAVRRGEVPAQRIGIYIRIPAEFLGMRVAKPDPYVPASRTYHQDDPLQMELPLDPKCLVPVRVWRNTGKPIPNWDYERNLWRHVKERGAWIS